MGMEGMGNLYAGVESFEQKNSKKLSSIINTATNVVSSTLGTNSNFTNIEGFQGCEYHQA